MSSEGEGEAEGAGKGNTRNKGRACSSCLSLHSPTSERQKTNSEMEAGLKVSLLGFTGSSTRIHWLAMLECATVPNLKVLDWQLVLHFVHLGSAEHFECMRMHRVCMHVYTQNLLKMSKNDPSKSMQILLIHRLSSAFKDFCCWYFIKINLMHQKCHYWFHLSFTVSDWVVTLHLTCLHCRCQEIIRGSVNTKVQKGVKMRLKKTPRIWPFSFTLF